MMSRRTVLKTLAFGNTGTPALVVVFLRGGADGLSLVPPRDEKAYVELRPTLAIRDPLPLDDRFGLHRALEPLHRWYADGRLAVVHAVGSDDETRSHFEAQDLMERAGRPEEGVSGGWLGRHLRSKPGSRGPVSAVALSPTLPESLRGAPSACAMTSIEEVALREATPDFTQALRVLYAAEGSGAGRTGEATFRLMERLQEARRAAPPEGYPTSDFGRQLREVARLLKADVGLEAACLDFGGWDTHFTQAPAFGGLAGELAGGLAAFAADLGPALDRTTIVVMTEFGRRAYENATLGTDHGRASVMFALGGGVRGGRVIAEWPGLSGNALAGPGDLEVTIDYRDVLGEILRRGAGNPNVADVFPGAALRDRGLYPVLSK